MEQVPTNVVMAPMLGDAAALIADFNSEISNEVLDDMLEEDNLVTIGECMDFTWHCVVHSFKQKVKKVEKKTLGVQVCVRKTTDPPYRSVLVAKSDHFECNRDGLRKAITYAQQRVNRLKTKGVCVPCRAKVTPQIKFAVGKTKRCASCVLKRVLD